MFVKPHRRKYASITVRQTRTSRRRNLAPGHTLMSAIHLVPPEDFTTTGVRDTNTWAIYRCFRNAVFFLFARSGAQNGTFTDKRRVNKFRAHDLPNIIFQQ